MTPPDAATYRLLASDVIECLLCESVSFNPQDAAHRYCGRCRMFHEIIAAARRMHAEGGTHECGEWRTWRDGCAICERRLGLGPIHEGDTVRLTVAAHRLTARVLMASPNGRSLFLRLDAAVFIGGGLVIGLLPVYCDEAGNWTDILTGSPITVER